MKEQPRTHFRNSNFKWKGKILQILQEFVCKKFYVHEKILHTWNCRRKFIKHLFTKKRKEKNVDQTSAI